MSTTVMAAGPRNGITIEKIEAEVNKSKLKVLTSPRNEKGKHGIVIEGFDFRKLNKKDQKQCNLSDCQNVTVRRCIFGNKNTKGVGLNIVGAKTRNITIEYCIFENMSFNSANGGEPLRLGLSDYSGITYNCIVRNCIFRNLRSDPEAISIKSCGNIVEDSFFINNKSNITVRHGGFAIIQHNLLRNGGGIRIHGYGNRVEYNCIENNQDEDDLAPIQLRYGDAEKDVNFVDARTPTEKAKDVDPVYARTIDTKVEGNEFKNCKKTVIELKKNGKLKPKDTIQNNNKLVELFSFEIPIPIPPPPVTPSPSPVPPVPEPPTPPPPTPDPEVPVTPPSPSPVPPTPTPTTTSINVDKYGIRYLYTDSDNNALVRYMDMDNPTKDSFLNKEERANLKKEPDDGSWSLDGKDTGKYQVRLGLWMNPKQTDIEATIYAHHIADVKGWEGESKYAYQFYRGGGDHSTSNNGCEGAAYKGRILENKSVVICKELRHPTYTSNEGGLKKLTKAPLGNWIGVKLVTYNMNPLGNRTPVMIQVYCDEQGMDQNGVLHPEKQSWQLMARYIDDGGWSAGSASDVGKCPPLEIGNNTGKRRTDEILNMPGGTDKGNVVTYRTDGAQTKIKYFSVRAIKPILADTPAGVEQPQV